MTKTGLRKMINKLRKHYRDQKLDDKDFRDEIFSDYYKAFQWFDDFTAERVTELAIEKIVSYGRIPQIAELLPIFQDMIEGKYNPSTQVEPLPEYHAKLANMNVLWFRDICFAYIKAEREGMIDRAYMAIGDSIFNWYKNRRQMETEIGRDLRENEIITDEDFFHGIGTWYKPLQEYVRELIGWRQTSEQIESNPKDSVPF